MRIDFFPVYCVILHLLKVRLDLRPVLSFIAMTISCCHSYRKNVERIIFSLTK